MVSVYVEIVKPGGHYSVRRVYPNRGSDIEGERAIDIYKKAQFIGNWPNRTDDTLRLQSQNLKIGSEQEFDIDGKRWIQEIAVIAEEIGEHNPNCIIVLSKAC